MAERCPPAVFRSKFQFRGGRNGPKSGTSGHFSWWYAGPSSGESGVTSIQESPEIHTWKFGSRGKPIGAWECIQQGP